MTTTNRPPLIKRFPVTDLMIRELSTNPTKIYAFGLYLTRKCNLKCIHCLSDAAFQSPHELTLEKRLRLIEEASKLGARQLIISGAGEPLLDKNFWRIVDFAHNEQQMFVLVYSNTTIITKAIAEKIKNYENMSIIGKRYSFSPAVNNRIFGGPFHAAVEKGLRNLMTAGLNEEQPTRLGFQCTIMSDNFEDVPDLLRFARRSNIFPQINLLFPAGRAKDQPDFTVTRKQYGRIYRECRELDRDEFGIIWDDCWSPDNPIIAGCCTRPKYWIMVDDLGEVRACSSDLSTRIGDVSKASIKEVLRINSDRVLFLRNTFKENDCFLCNPPRPDKPDREAGFTGRDLAR